MESELPQKFIQIDEEGYLLQGDARVNDALLGAEVLTQISFAPNGCFVSRAGGVPVIVEAFDEPLVALSIDLESLTITAPYNVDFDFKPEHLSLDEWDRFHGLTKDGIPFVLSRAAQASIFDQLDEYDDESITFKGNIYQIPAWLSAENDVTKEAFWTNIYNTEKDLPWSLHEVSPVIKDMVPRLKLTRSRILVLGAGEGHDAAYFAKEGHFVTAVDFSDEAIKRGKALYGDIANIKWIEADVLKLGPEHFGQYDYVVEHTCYCAIDPADRAKLVKQWRNLLTERGHLIGVFFAMHKRNGPPFGGSEWEIRNRLKSNFHMIFWGRWKASTPGRQGKELFIFAQKKNLL